MDQDLFGARLRELLSGTFHDEAFAQWLEKAWGALGEWSGSNNVAPTHPLLLLVRAKAGDLRLGPARFGWQVPWQKGPLLNARMESLAEKPTFRGPWQGRRAVVPVQGYYEWSGTDGQKQPWRFGAADGGPLLLAALWQKVENRAEAVVLTTAPNALAAGVHDRMPVVLSPEGARAWLAPGPAPAWGPGLGDSAPEGLLQAWRVDPAMGKPGAEGPWCAEPWAPPLRPEQGRLF